MPRASESPKCHDLQIRAQCDITIIKRVSATIYSSWDLSTLLSKYGARAEKNGSYGHHVIPNLQYYYLYVNY